MNIEHKHDEWMKDVDEQVDQALRSPNKPPSEAKRNRWAKAEKQEVAAHEPCSTVKDQDGKEWTLAGKNGKKDTETVEDRAGKEEERSRFSNILLLLALECPRQLSMRRRM